MNLADDFLKDFLSKYPQVNDEDMSLQEINKLIEQFVEEANNSSQPDLEGLSPSQIETLYMSPLSEASVIRINEKCPEELIDTIPLFICSELLLNEVFSLGKIKLTPKGNLPLAICKRLKETSGIEWEYSDLVNQITEDSVPYIWPVKNFLLIDGFVKKRHNTLSITKKGLDYRKMTKVERLKILILFFCDKTDWRNFYSPEETIFAQRDWGYSLYLFNKYGDDPRDTSFYSKKIVIAFEKNLSKYYTDPYMQDVLHNHHRAYGYVFFGYFARWFKLANIENNNEDGTFRKKYTVSKSGVFKNLFVVS